MKVTPRRTDHHVCNAVSYTVSITGLFTSSLVDNVPMPPARLGSSPMPSIVTHGGTTPPAVSWPCVRASSGMAPQS